MLGELPSANLVTYQQYTQDLYRERLDNADKNKTKVLGSSIVMEGQWMEALAAAP